MAQYKINRNKPGLSDEQINKHKDFSKVLSTHQKVLKYKDGTKPLYKNTGFMGLIVLTFVVILVFVFNDREETAKLEKKDSIMVPKNNLPIINDSTGINNQDTNTKGKIGTVTSNKEPSKTTLPRCTVPFLTYKIDATNGAVLYPATSRILIPPSAFVDAKGNRIEGEIEINYREFADPFDIYFSSISMHYDSASRQQLVSAGMFEIKGLQNGKAITIKEPITVELSTPVHSNYNTYYFNQSNNQWQYISKEKQSLRFVFEANEKEFPEMGAFKDLVWEIPLTSSQKHPEEFNFIFSKTWSKFFLSDKMNGLTPTDAKLKKNNSEPKFLVLPIAITSNKIINDQIIEAKYKQYYEEMKKKEKQEKVLAEARNKQAEWLKSPEGQAYAQWVKSKDGQKAILSSRIVSEFTVNKFGVWNCDTPEKLPQGASVIGNFVDQFGKKLALDKIYLVDYSKNSLFTYYENTPIKFNPKSENVLWAPLPGGKLALFSKDKFKSIPGNGKTTFQMEVIDINGKSAMEVKNILGIKNHSVSKLQVKEKTEKSIYERKVVMKMENRERDVFYREDSIEINSLGQRPQLPRGK